MASTKNKKIGKRKAVKASKSSKVRKSRKSKKSRRPSRAVKSAPKKVKAPKPIGKVTHYYSGIEVAIVKFSQNISVGATLRFKGATTDFAQKISEMQYDHKPVKMAKKGKQVGIKVKDRVREGDQLFKEV